MTTLEIYQEVRNSSVVQLPETIEELVSSQIGIKLLASRTDKLCFEVLANLKITGFATFGALTVFAPSYMILGVTPFPFLNCDILGIKIVLRSTYDPAYNELIHTPFRNDEHYHFEIESINMV